MDLDLRGPDRAILLEFKSKRTIDGHWLKPLLEAKTAREAGALGHGFEPILVYGGDQRQRRNDVEIRPWDSLDDLGPTPEVDHG